jgi:sigma-B regulation protein RsbU (phosphoserine phosphatase)
MDALTELKDDKTVAEFSLKSIITVPLTTSGKILGVIYLDNRQVKGLFNEENFELLKAFATEAAISIENAKLYAQVQQTARIEQELEIAKDIQTSILPNEQQIENYEIATYMRTATEVGGDYYDFYFKELPYMGVFGDVSGHGLKSGLIMLMAEVAFNALMKDKFIRQKPLKDIYQQINLTLYENIQERISHKSKMGMEYSHMYMTLRLFRFDLEGNFEIFGNDHAEPFIVRRKNKEIIPLLSTGFLIGIMEEATLDNDSFHFKLESGDLLVFYSDGITEAKNIPKSQMKNLEDKRVMYGEEKLFEVILENIEQTPAQIINAVTESVDKFMAEQEDDITLVIFKKL